MAIEKNKFKILVQLNVCLWVCKNVHIMIRKFDNTLGGEEPEGMYTPEGGLTREGYAKMLVQIRKSL